MKTNILLGMTVMLVILLALPAAASDYTLGVFGNANEDDTVNMQDVTYTELIILEYRDRTELSDAKHDGKINMQDVTQIELVILGKEKELTFIDVCEKAVTVKKPVEKIVVLSDSQADAIRVLGAEDLVVGISSGLASENTLLPVMSELPTVGGGRGQTLDYEAILDLQPDMILPSGESEEELEKKVNPWVTVVRFDFYVPEIMAKQMMELGYILDVEDKAEEFVDFYSGTLNTVKERTEELPEGEKPRVFYCGYISAEYRYYAITPKQWLGSVLTMAGGNNIAADLSANMVDPEWILVQNPDIIIDHEGSRLPAGYDTDDITGAQDVIEQMVNEPGWEKIKAVEDEKVYI
ncbi:MAG: ABC transporter substrate-binding protein, partial [Euryarchaeota archaeon]|nr:ABC transporter substrate-binding protein [Euryarchaeota archaeon]